MGMLWWRKAVAQSKGVYHQWMREPQDGLETHRTPSPGQMATFMMSEIPDEAPAVR